MYLVDTDDEVLKTSKYLYQFKDTEVKCGPKQKVQHTLSFQIPTEDPDNDNASLTSFNDQQRALSRSLTGSVNGDLYQVVYSLKVFVKHDGLTSRGEGACVTIPIRILPLPLDLYSENNSKENQKAQIEETKEGYDSNVKLAIDNLSQEYHKRFIKPWEELWLKGEKPVVLTEKEIA